MKSLLYTELQRTQLLPMCNLSLISYNGHASSLCITKWSTASHQSIEQSDWEGIWLTSCLTHCTVSINQPRHLKVLYPSLGVRASVGWCDNHQVIGARRMTSHMVILPWKYISSQNWDHIFSLIIIHQLVQKISNTDHNMPAYNWNGNENRH